MALDPSERARLQRIQRQLVREDPECGRRLRDYSARLADNAGPAEPEPVPWAGVLLVWAAVLAAAVILVAATAAGV